MPRLLPRLFALSLCLCLAACQREVVAPGDPVAAVKGLAEAIRSNDLLRYSRLSIPPGLHQKLEARWKAKLATAKPPTAKEQQDYAKLMARFTAPDAEDRLYSALDPKLKKLESEIGSQWPLMQTTAGIFINGAIQANEQLSASEKAHGKAVATALLAWLQPRLISDRARAKQAINILVTTARQLDLPSLGQTRALEMAPALEKASVALIGFKQIGRIYGIDADAALAGVQAKLVAANGDIATLQVSYPLLGKTVQFDMDLVRRDGRWYSADAVRSAEAELAQPLPVSAPAS